MLRTVRLYGHMGKEFGKSFQLSVRSLAEAVHALGMQIPGFRAAVEAGRFKVVCGKSRYDGLGLDESLITFGLPKGDIHITPVVRGSGSGGGGRGAGLGKIIAGVVIAAIGFVTGQGWLVSLGFSTALAGVSTLLAPKKKKEKQRKSYMFESADNTVDQGGPIPLAFGECMVSGKSISSGVTVSDTNGLV